MKHAVLVLAILLASGQRAHACDDFAPIVQPLSYVFGLGMAGGYLYGTGYFASHDLANDRTDNDYLTGDLAFNGLAGVQVNAQIAPEEDPPIPRQLGSALIAWVFATSGSISSIKKRAYRSPRPSYSNERL